MLPPNVAVAVSPTPAHETVTFAVLVSAVATALYDVVADEKVGEIFIPLLKESAVIVESVAAAVRLIVVV